MKVLRRFVRRLKVSVLGRRDDDRVREELAEHLTLLTEEYLRAGLPLDEARRRARLKRGEASAIEEQYRDEQGLRLFQDLRQDLRYGLRTLTRAPSFTVTAVLVLALGISANVTVFSFGNAFFLRPLPVAEPESLLRVSSNRYSTPDTAPIWSIETATRRFRVWPASRCGRSQCASTARTSTSLARS